MPWLISTILLFGSGCHQVFSKKMDDVALGSGQLFLQAQSNLHPEIISVISQVKAKWPIGAEEIIHKAEGNSDSKIKIDPALLSSILEAEGISDPEIPAQNLYEKVSLLRRLIENPKHSQNLFYVLAQYFAETHDRKYLYSIAQWQLNKTSAPNLFLYEKDGLPYADKNMPVREKGFGISDMGYLPADSSIYKNVNKVIDHYKKYYKRPEHYRNYEWVKQKFINTHLKAYWEHPAASDSVWVMDSQIPPQKIYTELYRKLVLLGAIPAHLKPSQRNLLRAVINSSYLERNSKEFKLAIKKDDISLVLSETKARELLINCEKALEEWRQVHEFFTQLKVMVDDSFKKELVTVADRDELMRAFIAKFNERAVFLKRPLFHMQLGKTENHLLDDNFYESFQNMFFDYARETPLRGPITSHFGEQRGKSNVFHNGTDIGAPLGTPIKSMISGKATVYHSSGGYGNYIVIYNEQTAEEVLYAHCSRIMVSTGTIVRNGEVVARVGSTGFSSGPHLHIEFKKNGILQPLFEKELIKMMTMTPLDNLVQYLSAEELAIP